MTTSESVPSTEELARLQSALLDPEMVEQLLTDVATLGEHVEVAVKRQAKERAEGARSTIDEARRALSNRGVLGVQLRYVYAGQLWVDTLLILQDGVRLTRIAHPAPNVPEGAGQEAR